MLNIEIKNSEILNLARSMMYPAESKNYYFDRILAKVFSMASMNHINDEIAIHFTDCHFCNIDYLDYKKLHKVLKKYFSNVTFTSNNVYDHLLDPEYFQWKTVPWMDVEISQNKKLQSQKIITWHENKKLFGLYISRPDVHRLALLIEFYRRNLLSVTDCVIGFNRNDLMADEFWRTSGIDLACKLMEISHLDFLNVIDNIPKSSRRYFEKTDHCEIKNGKQLYIDLDYEKSLLNNNFVIEIVCQSSATDNMPYYGEKVERVLALRQPFIILGSVYTYENMRNHGLMTFSDFWNESWDNLPYEQLSEKINRIGETCQEILKKYTCKEIFDLTRHIVDHNFQVHYDALYEYYGKPNQVEVATKRYKWKSTYDK